MTEDAIWHGGNLDEAERLFPQAEKPWIDLSTGINPVPYPIGPIPASAFERLSAPGEVAALERAAAAAYGVAEPERVVAAPGTQALIELLPRLRAAGHVIVIGPTYAEHAHAWRKAGHRVEQAAPGEGVDRADVAVLVNPNNPDGRIVSRAALQALAAKTGWLVVDEAFADLEDVESLAPDLPANAVVLRSFGKTYGLAGLRLGFAIAAPGTAHAIRAALGPWAVSGPAIAIGRRALADPAWLRAAAAARAADAARLDGLLAPAARLVGGTRLFRLFEAAHAPGLFAHLGRRGIWVRRFQDHANRLRFGLPGSEREWRRLEVALRSFEPG